MLENSQLSILDNYVIQLLQIYKLLRIFISLELCAKHRMSAIYLPANYFVFRTWLERESGWVDSA